MALGATVGAGAFGQSQAVSTALIRARLTGRPVPIVNADGSLSTLVAYPTGKIGTPGGGFGGARGYAGVQGAPGTPSGSAVTSPITLPGPGVPSQQQQSADLGLPLTGTPVTGTSPTQVQAPLNQARSLRRSP